LKILLDTCVWGGARQDLVSAGHDVLWAGDWHDDPGDEEILSIAYRESRVLVTLDKDFGELTVVHGRPHSGIIRLVNLPARQQGYVCARILERYQAELVRGAIATVERDRVRIRAGGK
jgi:predicted nuclease of predicted toxin-antitoxin system